MTDVMLAVTPPQMLAKRRRFRVLRKLAAHRSFKIGLVLVTILVLCAIIGPMLTGIDPTAMSIRSRFKPPSVRFPFGSDQYGRDILTRVLHGGRLSLSLGLSVALISGVFGALIGVTAGYFRAIDPYVMRLMDALMAFPAILLAIGIGAALGAQASSIVVALSVAYVPRTARIVRASVLVIREMEYLQAARVSGAGDLHIIVKHVLPNCLGPLIVQLTFIFAYAILAEAALSFLGIGPPPPTPSWGNIIAEGRDYSVEAWWVMLFPGLAVSLAALGMNLLGDGLRDVLDPRLKIET
ncbi:ABC transporter permease [Bradyrhizobium sp. 1]|nr:ABC transporter permease [Bradyrhizobium sp. 1]